ncbi:MAG TPA: 4-hydroxythreonine-4-phosphate dehydrogenase PdxA [Chloroflexota bacterium]|nr:4-hydroxythreonine-4-phosphate dehydrogenase PdxA [Chloroflexota bacterium]
MDKPVIVLTMGDPAGIGPEIVVRVLAQETARAHCRPLVIGEPRVFATACEMLRLNLQVRTVEGLADCRFAPNEIEVLRPPGLDIDRVPWGQLDPAWGEAAALCLRHACTLAGTGHVQGVVSAPLNKEAFHLAGYPHRDELEYMAEITGSDQTFIVGLMGALWTVAVTEHVPFRSIVDLLTKERITRYIGHMQTVLQRTGSARGRIGVAALNAHGGEGGTCGREEIEVIAPAIEEARAQGIAATGPIPADTIFVRALGGEFDGVVCLYHDQANIARKLHAPRTGATFFMGLPFACGTTAHGTAFDKAGQGIADPGSMETALRYTVALSGAPRP